ncbi:MAG: hypothetical protein VBE63_29600 [Lamprobacter sp.]|uniref:hypothetical protein n=1 Tax=Lamprobacter sp. TaxID=3100796 RepID=UPI002B257328|nr:hypothetical protein [Lamprobacter sp.]MEA3644046.1 hypothetical protein [Lamprobacter sp.]
MGTSVSLAIENMTYDVIAAGGMVAGASEPVKKRLQKLKVLDHKDVLRSATAPGTLGMLACFDGCCNQRGCPVSLEWS